MELISRKRGIVGAEEDGRKECSTGDGRIGGRVDDAERLATGDERVDLHEYYDRTRRLSLGGHVLEALWWWQFSYVNNWGNLAGAALNALLTVVAVALVAGRVENEHQQVT